MANNKTFTASVANPAIERLIYPPSINTVKGCVLGALLRGEHITHVDCWQRFGSPRLSHHVHILRRNGWGIEMREKNVATSDDGPPARMGSYYLPGDVIARTGKIGQWCGEAALRIELDRRVA